MRITIAATSFVHEELLPALAAEGSSLVRGFTVPQSRMGDYAARGIVDAVVTLGELRLPSDWSNDRVGELWYGLFGSPALAENLGAAPSVDVIRDLPFIGSSHLTPTGALAHGDDRCPLPYEDRTILHEVETMRLACLVASEINALVYGPAVAAAALVESGQLVEIAVPGWSTVEPVRLGCSHANVSRAQQERLAGALRSLFPPLRAASGVVSKAKAPATMFGEGRRKRS